MNLHQIVSGVISVVNPLTQLFIQTSNGYATNPDGKQVPAYNPGVYVFGDVQALDAGENQHLDALNIQGRRMKFYINGNIDGLIRPNQQGGDLITIVSGGNNQGLIGSTWLVAVILEYSSRSIFWRSAAFTWLPKTSRLWVIAIITAARAYCGKPGTDACCTRSAATMSAIFFSRSPRLIVGPGPFIATSHVPRQLAALKISGIRRTVSTRHTKRWRGGTFECGCPQRRVGRSADLPCWKLGAIGP
jgi:hypothetical protein